MIRFAPNALLCHPGLYARDPKISKLLSRVSGIRWQRIAQGLTLKARVELDPGDKRRDDNHRRSL